MTETPEFDTDEFEEEPEEKAIPEFEDTVLEDYPDVDTQDDEATVGLRDEQ